MRASLGEQLEDSQRISGHTEAVVADRDHGLAARTAAVSGSRHPAACIGGVAQQVGEDLGQARGSASSTTGASGRSTSGVPAFTIMDAGLHGDRDDMRQLDRG
jgi:hypothetical protein